MGYNGYCGQLVFNSVSRQLPLKSSLAQKYDGTPKMSNSPTHYVDILKNKLSLKYKLS